MIDNKQLSHIGALDAPIVLYLPNPPTLYPQFDATKPNLAKLVADNGNHWRKIFTILAKLSCFDIPWRHYKAEHLLQKNELISFSKQLNADSCWHLVAGKASWSRLGFDCESFTPGDPQGRLFSRDNILLVPYPDYRQFSNELIARTQRLMQQTSP